MDKRFLRGKDDKQQKEFKEAWANAREVRGAIIDALEAELQDSYKGMGKKDNFFMPAWSEYQASRLGEQDTLRSIINLIKDK